MRWLSELQADSTTLIRHKNIILFIPDTRN